MTLFTVLLLLFVTTATSYRLPTIYTPSSYTLSLTLPPEVFTTENATSYTGTVDIAFTTLENVSQVVLHASATHLNVTGATLDDATVAVINSSVNGTTDILTVSLNGTLEVNQTYVLTLVFDGRLSTTDMYGFYKSSYTDGTNATRYLVTTQMEPTYARRAFPCFDEPKYKATFDIALTYPTGQSALGNTLGNTTSNGSTTTTIFNTTPTMSTYLVAFIVSSFTCSSEGNLPYQVCSRNETASTRELALEVAPLVIDSLNAYLNINYSSQMEKLDQVAIPDFSAGAMENWGLLTYRERALLYDPNETSNANRQYTAMVIAHELTHQWFGNLVTCNWWSEIFLNEGFANFFEHFITHEIYPEFQLDKQFVIKTLQNIFEEDTSTSEALRQAATTEAEISSRFGSITYDKGASVLRMLEHILGTDGWKAGLTAYLNERALSTAEPEDLWRILGQNATGLPVNLTALMATWIDRAGYPVVHVTLNGTTLTFTQKRFVLMSNVTNTNATTWYVPITYTTSENSSTFQITRPTAWITPTQSLLVNVSSNLSWIVVNNLQTGYYRVNYDSFLWSGLATALRRSGFSNIPEINRAQIVNDAFNLARGGYITYNQLFDITKFLANETSYTVWYPAFGGFHYLLKRIGVRTTLGSAIATHLSNLTSTLIASVPLTTTNASNHIYTLTQVQAQTWACKLGSTNCTTEAVRLFRRYRNSSSRPDKNLRSIVYCYGLKASNDINADWSFLWNAFLSTSLSAEQVAILAALGCSDNTRILNEYLNKTLVDDSGIRAQDYASVFSAVYTGSTRGVDVALDFFINNYRAILNRYNSMNDIKRILKGISEQLTTDSQILKLQNFVTSNVLNGTVLETAQAALSSARKNQQWVSTYKSSLNSYYGIQDEPSTTVPSNSSTGSSAHPVPSIAFSLIAMVLLEIIIMVL